MVALSRNIPRKQAFEMLTTGEFIAADRARELGLINRVAAGDLAAEALEFAQSIANKLGSAVRIGKQAFYEQAQMTTAEAYAFTGDVMAVNMAQDDTDEGIKAFLEKRKPDWS
jgi:enoyl-CoA hydratase/carnithine racemase